jgi:hypothetical protein
MEPDVPFILKEEVNGNIKFEGKSKPRWEPHAEHGWRGH